MVIPEAAVEAAAKGIFAIRDDAYDMDEWEDLDSTDRELFTCQARAALEAAAPHMVAAAKAEAWDECVAHAAEMGCLHEFDAPDMHSSNPYRATK